jgi:hypothetical protein
MNNPMIVLRSTVRPRALFASVLVLSVALFSPSAVIGSNSTSPQPLADKAPALPLTATFEKVESADGMPFVLKVKNDSKESLTLGGKVLLSVVHHAMDKARNLPEEPLPAGQVRTIQNLSPDDKVILSAPGFSPMEIRVPFKI